MGFSAKQKQALRGQPDGRFIRTREARGKELTYLEGWYVLSEANRIFGFDGWNRETMESRCVLARETKGVFNAVYTARVRVTVLSGAMSIIREGHGTGEGRGSSPGEVHDIAYKAAETDATKRALATFGRPFGLELYRHDKSSASRADESRAMMDAGNDGPERGSTLVRLPPDDTTPIPRPSHYYGRQEYAVSREEASQGRLAEGAAKETAQPRSSDVEKISVHSEAPLVPEQPELARIDKSVLTISEPKRLRDKAHLRFVGSQPCLVCGRNPSDAHHLRFAQPRAIGLKVSDEFTVPLCRVHHRQVHQTGRELAWWESHKISPLAVARQLWEKSRGLALNSSSLKSGTISNSSN